MEIKPTKTLESLKGACIGAICLLNDNHASTNNLAAGTAILRVLNTVLRLELESEGK